MTPSPQLKAQVLRTAEALIYAHGVHAVGMDTIVRLSGVPRRSIYKHFGSKEGLVEQVLQQRHLRWMAWLDDEVRRQTSDPRERLLVMFDVLYRWFTAEDFHGCAFLNVTGQYADPGEAARVIAREHKAALLGWLESACAAAGLWPASGWARRFLVLVDGAIAVASVTGGPGAALDAKDMAAQLLRCAGPATCLPPSPPSSPSPETEP
ncbi:TetR/AcrR family transcriptional regulator [Aquabacterium sp. A7-Y]|uniref:TetR/AcrR family transcriptional regulator n=1 Tax=Aquabacterium sp. A7-Y TaxID=1349605 RepID=UPI00223D6BA5|nr:TetR/AcrR family transcriptional regulator [Aquabacterium sp. A7-Y]MCW7538774.1 TetR/AcrR family transcriptional regulator [Aquabacterium sp. A7-Y]